MAGLNLKSLIDKLNPTCRDTLESAAALCLSRTNYNVEIEHWLTKLVETSNSDIEAVLRHYGVDTSRLRQELTRALDRLKTGNARPPALSPHVVDLAREAWLAASVTFGAEAVRSGHLLYALLSEDDLRRQTSDLPELAEISAETLRNELPTITRQTEESTAAAVGKAGQGPAPAAAGKTDALNQFTIDLTERARAKQIDPVLGRDKEIRQLIDILTRRRQNNPILTGEAGVGKTAVVEGFALRISAGDVPVSLQNVAIRILDLGLLQAGAGVRGEFENRLKGVIDEVKASPSPIILFIDEAHTMIGAGGQAGQGDAANLLKPALARGELRTIAATTWAEYKKYFEKDAALARRFQVVKVEEPEEEAAIDMMRGLIKTLEGHHKIRITSDGIESAVRLSSRYISGRQLPDKAVSLLDTASARIALSQSTTPPAIEDAQRRISNLETAIEILQREAAAGADHTDRIAKLQQLKQQTSEELSALQQRRDEEYELVSGINETEKQLHDMLAADPKADTAPLRSQLNEKKDELARLQGETPLVHVNVDAQAIAETVSSWTGIPLGRMVADEINTVLSLREQMEKAIIGQSHALTAIAQRIQTARAQLGDPRQPIGVFLLAGPSGVGKTETAITLANMLYGGEQNMTVINMSEFKEEHKVSLLMGSPPGYVGYGEGGVLTEAVRRKPYCVLLLDEMEKAHPGVQDIFYQVFDKGEMKDGEGRDINFRNTVIMMTTNAGTDAIKSMCADPETIPEPDAFASALFPELEKTFKPAFLGRLTVVPYYPLSDNVLKQIITLKLDKIRKRIADQYAAQFEYSPELVATIAERCTEVDTGARNVDHILTKTLLPELAAEFLSKMAAGEAVKQVKLDVSAEDQFHYELQ